MNERLHRRIDAAEAVARSAIRHAEEMIMDLTALRQDVADLQAAGAAAAQEIQQLFAQVETLHNNGPDNVSQDDLDALANNVSAVTQVLRSTTNAATPGPGDATAGTAATAGGTAAAPGTAGAVAGGGPANMTDAEAAATPVGATTGGAPGTAAGATPSGTEATAGAGAGTRTLYTYTGSDAGSIDAEQWPEAPFRTNDGQQLYFYAGDVNPGDANGSVASADFQQYTGAAQTA